MYGRLPINQMPCAGFEPTAAEDQWLRRRQLFLTQFFMIRSQGPLWTLRQRQLECSRLENAESNDNADKQNRCTID